MKREGGGKGQTKEIIFRRKREWAKIIYFALVSNKDWKTLGSLSCLRLSQSSSVQVLLGLTTYQGSEGGSAGDFSPYLLHGLSALKC